MKKQFLLIVCIGLICSSCASLLSVANLVNCDFRMKSLSSAKLADVDVLQINSISSLNFLDIGKLTRSYLNENIPLDLQINVEAKNPNSKTASLSQFEWILLIDDVEMTRGKHAKPVEIPGNGVTSIPMNISFNLFELMKGESKDALLNFALNLADASNQPTRLSLRIKPTIYVNQVALTYPDYINVGTEF